MVIMYTFYKNYKFQMLTFITIVVIKAAFIAMLPGLSMTTGADEVGTIAGAAFFAGLDWSYVISTVPFYGFGYTMFMAPLFLMGLPPQAIFQIMLFCGAICLGFCGVICYNILTRFFDIADKWFCYLLSITAVFFINNNISTNWVYNEAILFLLGWLIIYILLIMYRRKQNGKNNYICSALLAFIMCYGTLCHARMLFYWGAIAVFLVCHYIITRKRLLQLSVFVPALAVFFIAARLLIDYVQLRLWLRGDEPLPNDIFGISIPVASPVTASLAAPISASVEAVAGTSFIAPISASVEAIVGVIDVGAIWAFIRIIIGHIFSMTMLTGGLILFLFVMFFLTCYHLFRKRDRSEAWQCVLDNKEIVLVVVYVISLLAAISLLTAIREAGWHIDSAPRDSKWFVYSRYWAAVAAPAIMVSAAMLKKLNIKKEIFYTMPLLASGICLLLLRYVVPYMTGYKWSAIFHDFRAIPLRGLTDILRFSDYLLISAVCFILVIVTFLLYRNKKAKSAIALVLAFFMFHNFFITAVVLRENSVNVDRQNNKIVGFFNTAGITNTEYYDIIADLPGFENLHLQFYLYDHRIIPANHPRELIAELAAEIESSIVIVNELPDDDSDIDAGDYLNVIFHADVIDGIGPFILVAKSDEQLTRRLAEKSYILEEIAIGACEASS